MLSWLADHESDVFFIATANDVSKLPAEFTRAERMGAIFFLDLPATSEKRLIWRMYRQQFGIEESQPQPDDKDWTGAEIKSCCRLAALLDVSLVVGRSARGAGGRNGRRVGRAPANVGQRPLSGRHRAGYLPSAARHNDQAGPARAAAIPATINSSSLPVAGTGLPHVGSGRPFGAALLSSHFTPHERTSHGPDAGPRPASLYYFGHPDALPPLRPFLPVRRTCDGEPDQLGLLYDAKGTIGDLRLQLLALYSWSTSSKLAAPPRRSSSCCRALRCCVRHLRRAGRRAGWVVD